MLLCKFPVCVPLLAASAITRYTQYQLSRGGALPAPWTLEPMSEIDLEDEKEHDYKGKTYSSRAMSNVFFKEALDAKQKYMYVCLHW